VFDGKDDHSYQTSFDLKKELHYESNLFNEKIWYRKCHFDICLEKDAIKIFLLFLSKIKNKEKLILSEL